MNCGNTHTFCSRLFFGSFLSLIAIFLVDYYFTILPFNGIYLFLYLLFVCLTTVWISFSIIQRLLRNSKPFQYDLSSNKYINCARYLLILGSCTKNKASEKELSSVDELSNKDLEERIQDFTRDVEKFYISRWYNYITTDNTFGVESRVLLGDITRRFLQVVILVDGKKLLHGILLILLRHVKEYRKTLKRVKKNGGNVEELYRYAHVGSKSLKAQEHFMHQLTTALLRQFINWELWNSLPCRTLVSILSRKLSNYLLIYVSKPGFINYWLLKSIRNPDELKGLNLEQYSFISLSTVHLFEIKKFNAPADQNKSNLGVLEQTNTPKETPGRNLRQVNRPDVVDIVRRASLNGITSIKQNNEEIVIGPSKDIVPSEPIKIHESKKADKTWCNSTELECISLGQDIANIDDTDSQFQLQHFMDKKLWDDIEDFDDKRKSNVENNLGESVVVATEHSHGSPPLNISSAATLLTNTIKGSVAASTFHNMKELQQSTVNNVVKPVSQATSTAIHKIGDLQDEAAGVMEGILDFGIAGIRKGLRLTGLQDNLTEGLPKTQTKPVAEVHRPSQSIKIPGKEAKPCPKLSKWPQIVPEDSKVDLIDSDDSVWINPLTRESPSFEEPILLEKSPSVDQKKLSEHDSTDSDGKTTSMDIPQISMDSTSIDSPEYEEPADFATTIAKLRSLLQQKSSESTSTTPAISPFPPDEAKMITPIENEINEVDGVMPSLYKFCARTATGVFQNTLNTIKTALPGNIPEHVRPIYMQDTVDNWTYVTSDVTSADLISRLEKLLSERREFCTVDTAYEAIDSLNIEESTEETWIASPQSFDDELDDFDVHIPVTKALVDILCELLSDADPWMVQESVVKSVLLLIGTKSEKFFEEKSEQFVRNVSKFIGSLPANLKKEVKAMKLEVMLGVCVESLPAYVRSFLGTETMESVTRLLISSLQCQKINQDVFMQIFELVAYQIIQASNQVTPEYSA